VISMIRKAYDQPDAPEEDLKTLKCVVEGMTIYDCMVAIHNNIAWRAPYYYAALRECYQIMDGGQLIQLLAAMTKGGNECIGRKRYAFSTLMDLVDPFREAGPFCEDGSDELPPVPVSLSPPFAGASASLEGLSALQSNGSPPLVATQPHPVARARAALWTRAEGFLDEYKENAFKAAFMEPVKVYVRCTGGKDLEVGNAQVHGANTYAAVLLSTLGVQLPLQPFLDDAHAHGRRCFLAVESTEYHAALRALASPENFGRDSIMMKECKGFRIAKKIPEVFVFEGSTPRCISNAAVDPDEQSAPKRAALAPYLERFMNYFTEDVLLERLFNFLSDERPDAMATCFAAMQRSMAGFYDSADDGDFDDYRYWFWDEDAWTFDVDRALHFFGSLGFIHPDHLSPPPPLFSRVATVESAIAAEHDRLERLEGKISEFLADDGRLPTRPARRNGEGTWRRGINSVSPVPVGHTLYSWLPTHAKHRMSRRRWPRSMSPPLGHTPYSWGLVSAEDLRPDPFF
jgi:hypothetical protein